MEVTKHPKQDFQVERLAFFSDAVFAIALTLLIIDFKIPEITKDSTYDSVWQSILGLKYNLFALILSFILISVYWFRHHFLFKHIHNYNRKILIANMIVLLPIIFFPFTTSLFAHSIPNDRVIMLTTRIYFLNHVLAMLAFLIFYFITFVKHKEFTYDFPLKERIEFVSTIIFIITVFSIFILCSFLSPVFNYIAFIMFPALGLKKWIDKRIEIRLVNKNNNTHSTHNEHRMED